MKGNNLFALSSGKFILMKTDVDNEFVFFRTDMQEIEDIKNNPIEMYYKFSKKQISNNNTPETFEIKILPNKTKALLIVHEINLEIDDDIKIYKPKKLGKLK